MKQKVLKALANPPRIFYVPYTLAVLNFLLWFMVFVISMIVFIILPPHEIPIWFALAFLGIVSLTHSILAFYSKQDPQISQLILSSFNVFKNKIPKRLIV